MEEEHDNDFILNKISKLYDIHEICNLQGRYIYYLQSHRYNEIIKLFASKEQVSIEMDNLGYFSGLEKVEAIFLNVLKPLYTDIGSSALHMLTTPLIDFYEKPGQAWGMWHTFGCNTQPGKMQGESDNSKKLISIWQQGKYFIDFTKEDSSWKFKNFRWYTNFRTPFNEGWVNKPIIGNLSIVSKIFPGCPEPDKESFYKPYDAQSLNEGLPLPPHPIQN